MKESKMEGPPGSDLLLSTSDCLERIGINCPSTLAVFTDIEPGKWTTEPTVLLHPYKVLVERKTEIRHKLEVLTNKWSKADREEAVESARTQVNRDIGKGKRVTILSPCMINHN